MKKGKPPDMNSSIDVSSPDYDVIVVGAGFAGLYTVQKLTQQGLSIRCFEAGSDVGGTWFWNKYPGAQCDVESLEYSYGFSEKLQQDWQWSRRFAGQSEILAYANHVADQFDLRQHIEFNTRVRSAEYVEDSGLWRLQVSADRQVSARFLISDGLRVGVAEEASVLAAFENAESRHGPIDVLACFAGIASRDGQSRSVAFVDQEAKEWDQVMAVNARGTFYCVREMLRRRAALRVVHGRVITVSSVAGQFGAIRRCAVYSASKGAVLSLTKVAAREAVAFDVTVNAIAPGPIASPMLDRILRDDLASVAESIPMKRIGLPTDVAAAVSYLASVEAGYVTGAAAFITGGYYPVDSGYLTQYLPSPRTAQPIEQRISKQ